MIKPAIRISAAEKLLAGGGRGMMTGAGGGEESPSTRAGIEALTLALSRPEAGPILSSRKFDHQHPMSMQGPWLADGFRYLLDPPAR